MTRHASTEAVTKYFTYAHLPEGKLRTVSAKCSGLVAGILDELPADSAELTAGLRKLLEAKDCFVRAALDA